MNSQLSPFTVFIVSFIASAASGIAAHLRSGKTISPLSLGTAGLNSGMLGLGISMIYFKKFQEDIYSLIGYCVIMGLSGAAGFDLILSFLQKRGLFQEKADEKSDQQHEK